MREELIEYVMRKADGYYSDAFPIMSIEVWIREFFEQYRPERLSPEGTCVKTYYRSDDGKYEPLEPCVSDSLNSTNK